MKGIFLLITLILFIYPCNSQQGYQTITSRASDSIIHQLESYYKNASSKDRSKFESFVRSIEMVDPKHEITTIIKIFGKAFYKKPLNKFKGELDDYITSSFPKLPNDHTFWENKLTQFDSIRISEKPGTYVMDHLWNDPNHGFHKDQNSHFVSFGSSKSQSLSKKSKHINALIKGRITTTDSIMSMLMLHEPINERYDLIIMFIQNLSADGFSGHAFQVAEKVSQNIIEDKQLNSSQKVNILLALNKLAIGYSVYFYSEMIVINYAHIRSILENPILFKDKKINSESRKNKLRRLDNFEIQSLLSLSEVYSDNLLYFDVAWDIFQKRIEKPKTRHLSDFMFMAEFISKRNYFYKKKELFDTNKYPPKMVPVLEMNESWSLFQVLEIIKDYKTQNKVFPPNLMDRFYRFAMTHFLLNEQIDMTSQVMKHALINMDGSLFFLNDYADIIPEIYNRNDSKQEFKWWQKHLNTPLIDIVNTTLFLPSDGVVNQIDNFTQLTERDKRYFLSKQFLSDLSAIHNQERFLDHNFPKGRSFYDLYNYCFENKAFDQADAVQFLQFKIQGWGGYKETILEFLSRRSFIINGITIKGKSYENNLLRAYQDSLTSLNGQLNTSNQKLNKKNSDLNSSLIFVIVFGVIILGLFLVTRRTKNKLKQKSQELEEQKRSLEAVSLSIGQIGHLAKNAISEIHNSYFKTPTQYEIDIGKKALKRLRNVFQKFEENGNKTTQKVEEEILFAADLILIQNRKFGEQKTKQDIIDRIICDENPLVYSKVDVPIYTVVNILDNTFKHSDLSDDIQVIINGLKRVDSPRGFWGGKILMIECTSKIPKNSNSTSGTGTEYITKMLKLYSNWEYAYYIKGQTTNNGYKHSILLMKKDTYPPISIPFIDKKPDYR